MAKLVEAGWMRNIGEDDRSAIDETAGGDGAGMGIFDGRMNTTRGHARRARQRSILRFIGSGLRRLLAESKVSGRQATKQGKNKDRRRRKAARGATYVHFCAAAGRGSSTVRN